MKITTPTNKIKEFAQHLINSEHETFDDVANVVIFQIVRKMKIKDKRELVNYILDCQSENIDVTISID